MMLFKALQLQPNKHLSFSFCSNMTALPTFYNDKEHIWSGPPRQSIYANACSVGKVIFATMKNWPKNICQISDTDGVAVTFEQALTWAIRIAQHLKLRGLSHKHVIGIVGKNTTYVMPLAVACLMNTTPFHAVSPMHDETTLRSMYDKTRPTLIFCDGGVHEKVCAATKSWNPAIYTLTEDVKDVPKIDELLAPTKTEMFYLPQPLTAGADQTMAILCSSGTTGMPKAVCISNSVLIQENMLVTSESVIYTSSSLDWITGLWAFVFSTVFGVKRIITNRPFTAEYFVELVHKHKINYAVIPPRHLSALVNCSAATVERMASVRMLNYGGGLVSMSTLQSAQALCKNAALNSGYGITEAGAISINLGIATAGTAGKLLPGVRMRIVDEQGKNLAYDAVGEIYVQQPFGWNGYYDDPVATRHMQDADGWFHTGDLGYFDDKDFLHVVDRKKEILKYEGMHYWPTEIEHIITELPQVQEVCVVGIYDERHGDAAGALIVRQTKANDAVLSAADVAQHVQKRSQAVFKQLHAGVHFVDKLPQNVNGKIMRHVAKEMFLKLQQQSSVGKVGK